MFGALNVIYKFAGLNKTENNYIGFALKVAGTAAYGKTVNYTTKLTS